MNVQLEANPVKVLSEKTITTIFSVMTFCAVLPLYFEDTRQLCGLIFIGLMGYLFFTKRKPTSYKIRDAEMKWIAVSVIYATIFIMSFLMREPYTDDGSWRIAAPVFILLLTAWYYLVLRYNRQHQSLSMVTISSVMIALLLLIIELLKDNPHEMYRLGLLSSDLGAVGFIVPITTVALAILWLQRKDKILLALFVVGFILTGVSSARTSLALVAIPMLFAFYYLFFAQNVFSKLTKLAMSAVAVLLFIFAAWFSQDKLLETFDDFAKAEQGEYYSSLGLRYAMLDVGSGIVSEHPLVGVGPSQYKSTLVTALQDSPYSQQVKGSIASFMQIHNQYLMDALLSGIFGLVSLLLFMGYPAYLFYRRYRLTRQLPALIALGLMLGIAFIQFFGANFTYTYTTIFYMLAISSVLTSILSTNGEEHG
jgi:O-antigen ligase